MGDNVEAVNWEVEAEELDFADEDTFDSVLGVCVTTGELLYPVEVVELPKLLDSVEDVGNKVLF